MPQDKGSTFRECTADGCRRRHAAKGYCGGHYQAHRDGRPIVKLLVKTFRTEPIPVRLERGIRKGGGDECWEWLEGHTRKGYGRLHSKGRLYLAHRLVYEMAGGYIAPGLVLDHLCRNHGCCNPAHLEPVTNKVNVLRGFGAPAMNARKTHCLRGHPLSGPNLHIDPKGGRQCKECGRQRGRLWARRRYGFTGIANARKTHCKHGHPFAGDNLRVLPNGSRRCRTCRRASKRREYAKRCLLAAGR